MGAENCGVVGAVRDVVQLIQDSEVFEFGQFNMCAAVHEGEIKQVDWIRAGVLDAAGRPPVEDAGTRYPWPKPVILAAKAL